MASIPRQRAFIAVYVWLERNGKVIALQRQNTGYMDGLWCPPAGGVDKGESVLDCVVRECREEVGVEVDATSIELVHTLHRKTPERFVIDLFFKAQFSGTPFNAEPHKASQIDWVDPLTFTQWMSYIPNVLRTSAPYSEQGFE